MGSGVIMAFIFLATGIGFLFPEYTPVQKEHTYELNTDSLVSQLMWMGQDDGE